MSLQEEISNIRNTISSFNNKRDKLTYVNVICMTSGRYSRSALINIAGEIKNEKNKE